MTSPEVRILANADEVAAAVARELGDRLRMLVPVEGTPLVRYDLALTGGGVARKVHRALAEQATGIPWGLVHVWWGDERFVAAESEERNAAQARTDLLDSLRDLPGGFPWALADDQVHTVPSTDECDDVDHAAAAYSQTMRTEGSGAFDLVMLGMGADGHVASLFPRHPELHVDDRVAVAVKDSPKPPPQRVSLTYAALNRTAATWFLVTGEDKADAVARALADQGGVTETPARGIEAAEVVWWLDEAAASRLAR